MPRRIAILPDSVADQIAAGEVVERPASAVKELVENALDAGATRIRVALEQGGKTLIEVSDDGCGMGREDAVLALDRHATSKIRSAADLVGVRTFGFRGEALPAIASVSRLLLQTSEGDGDGSEIEVAGGRVERIGTVARQRGTTVTVRGLFFNTPARRKFLRSASSETRASHDAVATLALAHPETGFELHLDGRLRLLAPPGQTLEERLALVWGPDLARTLIPVDYAYGSFRITGFVQRPADARPAGRRTQLFVNGRPFRDPFLVRAAEAGYRSAIAPGDRPSLFLRVETAPEDVDVNVHPAKLEVRFRDRIGVERVVEAAVREALSRMAAVAVLGARGASGAPGGAETNRTSPADPASQSTVESDSGWPCGPTEPAAPLSPLLPAAAFDVPSRPAALPVFQLFDTYLVYQTPDALVFVDQHSAHERVIYEGVMASLEGRPMPGQRLLLPLPVELTDEELDAVEEHRELLDRLGYEVEPFGGRAVLLQAVPTPHPRFDGERCFREMVADLARGRFGGWANRLERFAATYACRAAVKAGERLEPEEMQELLARLFATALPPHDVHGRATMVQLPRDELERRFGRR